MWTRRRVTGGFDTHADTNVPAILDTITFRPLARATSPTTAVGHQAALEWMRHLDVIDAVGVESTGSHGAGLARHLGTAGVKVVEVNRPEKLDRSLDDKDDYLDAEAPARAVLSGRATASPKSGNGPVEAIRSFETAHESAAHDRVAAINQSKSMTFRAPDSFRDVFTTKTFQHHHPPRPRRAGTSCRLEDACPPDPVPRRPDRHRWAAIFTGT